MELVGFHVYFLSLAKDGCAHADRSGLLCDEIMLAADGIGAETGFLRDKTELNILFSVCNSLFTDQCCQDLFPTLQPIPGMTPLACSRQGTHLHEVMKVSGRCRP